MLLLYIRSVSLALRTVVFAQFNLSMKVLWGVMVSILALLGYAVSVWVMISVLLLGALLYRKFFALASKGRYRLVKKNDRIEYAPADEESMFQEFRIATVREHMRKEALAGGQLFDPDQLKYYTHFFLISDSEKSRLIPFEWIISIEVDETPD